MQHPYQGAIRTVASHIRTAAIHQRAVAQNPLSSFVGKQSVDALAGFYLRSVHSHRVLNDIGVDCVIAQRILDNTAKAGQQPVGPLSELAVQAKSGSYEARQSVKAALQSMLDEINDGLKANVPILQAMLADAKKAIVKATANAALDTKSLRHAGGAGLQLVEGTHIYNHLPAQAIHGHGGLTADGEKRLAEFVTKDYQRELEDDRILADEYAAHDKRAIQSALKAKAVAALASLGGGN